MTPTDIGDGGPPVDIPDQWLPDWQTHVRDALAKGRRLRAQTAARKQLQRGLNTALVARRTGLDPAEVAKIRAALDLDPGYDLDGEHRKILDYPLRGPAHEHPFYGRQNTRRRIRILRADPPPDVEEIHLPEHRLTITITPINQPGATPHVGEDR